VVVVPQQRGVLLARIVAELRAAGHGPVLGIAVALRSDARAVHVRDGAYFGLVAPGAVQPVVDRKEVLRRQFVDPVDQQSLPAARFDGRAW
jgi:hypothetical protein